MTLWSRIANLIRGDEHGREESRDIRIIPWLESLRADAVFGWRQLMKR
jgi:hypothetical protein